MDKITQFKNVMGNYPTGVTVVTTYSSNGEPIGLTVNSFASVSLEPTLILWSIDKKASTHDDFRQCERFAVNILAADQGDLCNLFATRGVDRFDGSHWEKSELGLPVLLNTAATLQCKNVQQIDAGDHTTLIGEVIEIVDGQKDPLLYHRRNIGAIPKSFYEKE